MIRQYLVSSVLALACFTIPASAEDSKKTAQSAPPSIVVLGHAVTLQQVAGCPKHPTSAETLAKYLRQYDVRVEKHFYSTAYKYSPLLKDGYPSYVLQKNWDRTELEDIVRTGFGHNGENEPNTIAWYRFSGATNCDFSSYGDTGGMRARIGRAFLFRGLENSKYQLVMSLAADLSDVSGQNFISLDVGEEKFPIVINLLPAITDLNFNDNAVFQWNPSINGFNVCKEIADKDQDEMSAFKIYVKTAIAPKDSFLGKLCASPQAQQTIVKFVGRVTKGSPFY